MIDFVPPPSPGYVQRYITPTTIAFFSIVAKELFMTIIRVVHEGQNFKEAYNERQVTNPSFSKIGLEFKIFIMLKVSASFMVFVIFEGIVFCSKSCYENYDFYHWNCFNWWYFPLWLKNINWNESFYYQKLKKASIIWRNHIFYNVISKCDLILWFQIMFSWFHSTISLFHQFCFKWIILREIIESFTWKHWTEYEFLVK